MSDSLEHLSGIAVSLENIEYLLEEKLYKAFERQNTIEHLKGIAVSLENIEYLLSEKLYKAFERQNTILDGIALSLSTLAWKQK